MKRTIWGLGPSLLILLGLAGLLILAAVAAYLFNMGPVPTHPPQNGSIIQMEPGAGMHS
jgi:hypothetical protein